MKFVSNISIQGGLSVPFLLDLDNHDCHIDVSDENGPLPFIPIDALNSDFYLGHTTRGLGGSVVKYDKRAASVFEHIDTIVVVNGYMAGVPHGRDFMYMKNGSIVHDFVGKCNKATLVLDDCWMQVHGYNRSVVEWTVGGGRTMCNFYDMLSCLCKEANVCFMGYEELLIYSSPKAESTIISFNQSDESKTFFTKMFFDCKR